MRGRRGSVRERERGKGREERGEKGKKETERSLFPTGLSGSRALVPSTPPRCLPSNEPKARLIIPKFSNQMCPT